MDHEVEPVDFYLTIGSIKLVVSWLVDANPGLHNKQYQSFFHDNKPETNQPTIHVQVLEGVPPVQPSRVVFNSDYWTLHECGNDQYLVLFPRIKSHSFVVQRDFRSAQLYIDLAEARKVISNVSSLISLVLTPVDQLLVMHSLVDVHGLVVHSAGGRFHGKGIILPAVSTGGKSTVSRLLSKDSQNQLYSDDRMIIRLIDKKWHLFGTPWHGDEAIAVNEQVPLDALVFLTQADRTVIRPLPVDKALKILMRVSSIPLYDEMRVQKSLDTCERLLQAIPTYELLFTRDESVVQVIDAFAARFKKRN